jgi:hypothetical protein
MIDTLSVDLFRVKVLHVAYTTRAVDRKRSSWVPSGCLKRIFPNLINTIPSVMKVDLTSLTYLLWNSGQAKKFALS